MAKKKEEKVVEAVAEEVVEETTEEKKELGAKKVWTEVELAVLPREEYLAAEADIKAGRASIKID